MTGPKTGGRSTQTARSHFQALARNHSILNHFDSPFDVIVQLHVHERTEAVNHKAWNEILHALVDWGSEVQDRLKTESGEREIDLHSSMAKMLRDYMGKRTHEKWASKTNLLFASRNGKPLHQSNVLRRKLHPVLVALGQPKCGVHAFRRFRNTYLRNFTATPPGLLQFWMGHAGEGMSDLYDKIKLNVAFRKKVAEQAGLGFELPSKIIVIGRNGRKLKSALELEMTATA